MANNKISQEQKLARQMEEVMCRYDFDVSAFPMYVSQMSPVFQERLAEMMLLMINQWVVLYSGDPLLFRVPRNAGDFAEAAMAGIKENFMATGFIDDNGRFVRSF